MATIQKITPCLWFDKNAEEAVNFYMSVFKNGRTLRTLYYGKEGFEIHGMPEGVVLTIEFEAEGQKFLALNGGPAFKFNEAVSFIINCANQEEIDYYWEKLGEGGDEKAQACGWLKDKFGVSWQVTPTLVSDLLADPDPEKSQAIMRAILQMKKIEIDKLRQAYEEKPALT